MTSSWHPIHLDKFIETTEYINKSIKGKNPSSWHLSIKKQDKSGELQIEDILNLPLDRQDRADLRKWLDECNEANIADNCVNIMAWGGMNTKYGHSAFSTFTQWMPIIEDLHAVKIDAVEAYDQFLNLRISKQLKGMGIAYFTKLLFFFTHSPEYLQSTKRRGYILDQWTARSINLLCNRQIVDLYVPKTDGAHTVTDKNSSSVYLQFCDLVEELSKVIGQTPSRTEELLFCTGNNKGAWRKYVIQNHKQL